ncbi:beta-lactamase class A [Bacillus sp. RC55]|uniref:Beta-lactamase n=1 Tax=Bacillus mycoides TaxID=1405 RepID=A0AAP8GUI9_BACMY|nr:beta-lactamase family protein [Bacillus mycoides]ETT83964.1 beta-lactamase [Bacillus mycoides FSL H7-687]EOO39652.1 beta-lactamase 1 [Bacillus mycoides]KUH42627.1 hypothetical protein M2E15_2723 [Bacillus mycoides]PJN62968.1 Beta-lactamase precursor [Bacillus mycoides]
MNEAIPGDICDTSTAKTLATNLKAFTVRDALQTDKRKIPTDWMRGNATGDELIHAGVPKDWEVDDKSGAGSYGTPNDILPSFSHRIENQRTDYHCNSVQSRCYI